MPLLYTLLTMTIWLAVLPFMVVFSFKKKYRQSIPQRFFPLFNRPFKAYSFWFHACSLGEVRALKPIVNDLGASQCAISTITQTGYDAAKEMVPEARFLPFEFFLFFWIKRRPATLVVVEAELWYLLFFIAKRRSHRVILMNARISERSFKKYLRLKWLYSRIFAQCNMVLAQSEEDATRLRTLGAKNIDVVGNIKLMHQAVVSKTYAKPEAKVIVAASTHDKEEALIIDAFLKYKKRRNAKLIVVPRHPERFDAVFTLLKQMKSLRVVRFSQYGIEALHHHDVLLMDAMGELINIYNIADIAIIGGSFVPIGGHNPLEAAAFGCHIISGKYNFFQKELFNAIANVQVIESEALSSALERTETMPPSQITGSIDREKLMNYLKG